MTELFVHEVLRKAEESNSSAFICVDDEHYCCNPKINKWHVYENDGVLCLGYDDGEIFIDVNHISKIKIVYDT